jgi:hypothetical protein
VIYRRFHPGALAVLFGLLFCLTATAADRPPVRLVLQVTIDGLRADLIARYADRFGDGGFRFLLDKGVVFTNANYRHANTETIVGHSTLATGAHPSVHGMTGNVWFDHDTGDLAYNIEDQKHPILPTRMVEQKGDQVDPSQKLARTQGRSPSALLAPTLSDTLSAFTAGAAKIFGVSGKDRSAVAMAGKTGKAFWYSTNNGDFVTSDYYILSPATIIMMLIQIGPGTGMRSAKRVVMPARHGRCCTKNRLTYLLTVTIGLMKLTSKDMVVFSHISLERPATNCSTRKFLSALLVTSFCSILPSG